MKDTAKTEPNIQFEHSNQQIPDSLPCFVNNSKILASKECQEHLVRYKELAIRMQENTRETGQSILQTLEQKCRQDAKSTSSGNQTDNGTGRDRYNRYIFPGSRTRK